MPSRPARLIPWALILSRLALGPAALWASIVGAPGWVLVGALWLGVVSDILDGVIARRVGNASAALRRCDSQADLVFFLFIIVARFVRAFDALRPWAPWIGVLLALEAGIYAISLIRFRREPCTHAYSAKAFGLMMLKALTAVLGWQATGGLFIAMIAMGFAMQADCIGISLILPRWERDVPSSYHALRIRRGLEIRRHRLFHSA